MNRRGFFAALLAPFAARFFPKPLELNQSVAWPKETDWFNQANYLVFGEHTTTTWYNFEDFDLTYKGTPWRWDQKQGGHHMR